MIFIYIHCFLCCPLKEITLFCLKSLPGWVSWPFLGCPTPTETAEVTLKRAVVWAVFPKGLAHDIQRWLLVWAGAASRNEAGPKETGVSEGVGTGLKGGRGRWEVARVHLAAGQACKRTRRADASLPLCKATICDGSGPQGHGAHIRVPAGSPHSGKATAPGSGAQQRGA